MDLAVGRRRELVGVDATERRYFFSFCRFAEIEDRSFQLLFFFFLEFSCKIVNWRTDEALGLAGPSSGPNSDSGMTMQGHPSPI